MKKVNHNDSLILIVNHFLFLSLPPFYHASSPQPTVLHRWRRKRDPWVCLKLRHSVKLSTLYSLCRFIYFIVVCSRFYLTYNVLQFFFKCLDLLQVLFCSGSFPSWFMRVFFFFLGKNYIRIVSSRCSLWRIVICFVSQG